MPQELILPVEVGIRPVVPAIQNTVVVDERSAQRAKLPTIQALRGIAAMAVFWFHMTYGLREFSGPAWMKRSGMYGWLGVQVFFVISGFLIPYTLYQGGYDWRRFGWFLKKRLARLHPPYLCVLVIVLGYQHLESIFPIPRSKPIPVHWNELAAHAVFLNRLFGFKWSVAVFWTLAVEFQFYLLLGLSYGLLANRRRWLGAAWCALMAACALLWPSQDYLPHHLPIFCCGLFAFRYACLKTGWAELAGGLILASALCYRTNGPPVTYVALGTTALILFVRYSNGVLDFFGEISYSFYLLHAPIGGAIVYEGLKRHPGTTMPVLIAAAYVASLAAAWLLYRWVELPSKRWASAMGRA